MYSQIDDSGKYIFQIKFSSVMWLILFRYLLCGAATIANMWACVLKTEYLMFCKEGGKGGLKPLWASQAGTSDVTIFLGWCHSINQEAEHQNYGGAESSLDLGWRTCVLPWLLGSLDYLTI